VGALRCPLLGGTPLPLWERSPIAMAFQFTPILRPARDKLAKIAVKDRSHTVSSPEALAARSRSSTAVGAIPDRDDIPVQTNSPACSRYNPSMIAVKDRSHTISIPEAPAARSRSSTAVGAIPDRDGIPVHPILRPARDKLAKIAVKDRSHTVSSPEAPAARSKPSTAVGAIPDRDAIPVQTNPPACSRYNPSIIAVKDRSHTGSSPEALAARSRSSTAVGAIPDRDEPPAGTRPASPPNPAHPVLIFAA
jgi:hypothetical protein